MNIGIDNYYILLLLAPLFFIIFFNFKNNGINSRNIVFYVKGKKTYFFLYRLALFILGCLLILLLSGLHIQNYVEDKNKNGIDINIVLDVSYSMDAKDLLPSRIEVAKSVLGNFVKKVETDRIGLIVFAGKPFTSIPLNFDYYITQKIVEKIKTKIINQDYVHLQGTGIGNALLVGIDNFDKKELDRKKVIILITDGTSNVGVNPLIAGQYAQENNVKVYTIGIGSDKGGYVDIKTSSGIMRQEVGGVDERLLKEIAETTGGIYYRGKKESELNEIFTEINKLEKTNIKLNLTLNKKYFYTEIINISFILLLGISGITFLLLKEKS